MVAAPTTTKRSSKQLFKQMEYAEDSDSDKDDDNDDDSSCSDSDSGSDGSEEDVEPVMNRPSKSKSDSNLNEDLTVGMHIVIDECELFPGTRFCQTNESERIAWRKGVRKDQHGGGRKERMKVCDI